MQMLAKRLPIINDALTKPKRLIDLHSLQMDILAQYGYDFFTALLTSHQHITPAPQVTSAYHHLI